MLKYSKFTPCAPLPYKRTDMYKCPHYDNNIPCCDNPVLSSTDDGNRHQECGTCGWSFNADEFEKKTKTANAQEKVLNALTNKTPHKLQKYKIPQYDTPCCDDPSLDTTNDGRHQFCFECGWEFDADTFEKKSEFEQIEFQPD